MRECLGAQKGVRAKHYQLMAVLCAPAMAVFA
jgi:hypothetical protein